VAPDPHIRAAFYLSPTLDALWRWSVDGETLVWADDRTIAFRAEVDAVLRRLAPGGLPPFGAVALLLGACRGDAWADSYGRQTIAGYARTFGGMRATVTGAVDGVGAEALSAAAKGFAGALVFRRVATEVESLVAGLDAISRLPAELREGSDAKALIAEVVFEAAKNRSPAEDADLVIRALDEGVSPDTLRPQLCNEEALSQFARQVDGLAVGLQRVDAETLARRKKTGLDESVIAPDEDLAPPERVRRLLAELSDDPELAGVARLASDLMAAVSIPRPLRLRDELAVGGVSDLTNRGPLDRLLVSELAHDDLTLAVRVAVNEALYLRRESPPREPPHRRAILLDAGIRMWGVPRVFAAAVALALAATNDPRAELSAFRATSDGRVESVDLMTRRGVEAHLGHLETRAHPGAALAPFFNRLASTDDGDDSQHPTDAILVTHADVLADPAFLAVATKALADVSVTFYVAAVDRAGAFRLVSLSRAGLKVVREAELSLDTILAERPRRGAESASVPLIAKGVELSLPAILYADPFPFRLPHVVQPAHAAASDKWGLVAATDDGRLLHWPDGGHGARQITAVLPRGVIGFVGISEHEGQAVVLISRDREGEVDLVTADLTGGRAQVSRLPVTRSRITGAYLSGDAVHIVFRHRVDMFSLLGTQVGSTALSEGMAWVRGRYFRHPGAGFYCVPPAGPAGQLEPVLRPPLRTDVAMWFDREGVDEPLGFCNDGSIFTSTGKRVLPPNPERASKNFKAVSPDGHRLLFDVNNQPWLFDLRSHTWTRLSSANAAEQFLMPQLHWSTRSGFTPRVKFTGLFVDSASRLCFVSRRGQIGFLDFIAVSEGMVLAYSEPGGTVLREGPRRMARQFHEQRRSSATRARMHMATWDDGSRAFLDGRGMIHLKSSDRGLPELSIALTSRGVAAWSSDGRVGGSSYLLGDDVTTTAPAYFLNLVSRFVERLR
jgi:hypothetical protein